MRILGNVVDETYRTRQTNQRINSVYLGALEIRICEWFTTYYTRNEAKKYEDDTSVLIGSYARKKIDLDITPRIMYFYYELWSLRLQSFLDRFNRWLRVRTRRINDNSKIFRIPLIESTKIPERLFALSITHINSEFYLTYFGNLEPESISQYLDLSELSTKKNARQSIRGNLSSICVYLQFPWKFISL